MYYYNYIPINFVNYVITILKYINIVYNNLSYY